MSLIDKIEEYGAAVDAHLMTRADAARNLTLESGGGPNRTRGSRHDRQVAERPPGVPRDLQQDTKSPWPDQPYR